MLLLPALHPAPDKNKFYLKGFSASLTIVFAGFAALFCAFTGLDWPILIGTALALLSSLGILWPAHMVWPYRIWNRVVRIGVRYASELVLRVCFYVVFVATGRAGSALQLGLPGLTDSLWVSRVSVDRTAYAHQHSASGESGTAPEGWMSSLFAWAGNSKSFWVIGLLPFFLLLSILQFEEAKDEVPSDIYTLY